MQNGTQLNLTYGLVTHVNVSRRRSQLRILTLLKVTVSRGHRTGERTIITGKKDK